VRGAIAASAGLGALLSCEVALAGGDDGGGKDETATPIKHLIVLIAENWTFDSIYGTY
jgi:phospholipase C